MKVEEAPFISGGPQTYQGPPTNEEELERERLREMLSARRRGPIEQAWTDYQQWGEEHPWQQLAAETALTSGASEIVGAATRLPGLVGAGARGLRWLEEHTGGQRHDWGGGRNIKDPKYKLATQYKDDDFAEYAVHRKEGGDPIGRLRFDYHPDQKQLYLGWASKQEGVEDLGAGQMMHLFREVGKDFPDAETVRFFRIPNVQKAGGGTVGRKGYTEEVTLPLKRREKGVESEATREMFGKAVEQEQKQSRVIRRRMVSEDIGGDIEDIAPDYSLIEMTPHEREIVNLMESGGLEDIMHFGSEGFRERARNLGSQEAALEVNDQIRNKALREVLEQTRRQSGIEGPIPSFDDAYDTGLRLEQRAQHAAWQREEQRLTTLLQRIQGGTEELQPEEQPFFRMSQQEADEQALLGRPLEHRVATRHGYGTPEHYEQRSEIENVTPIEHAKVLHIARERGISEDEALDTYNAIQSRLMEDRLWPQTRPR